MKTATFSGSAVRFLVGLLAMLCASILAACIVGNALVLWNPNWGGQNLVAAMLGIGIGPCLGLAAIALGASYRHDGMLFLGGLTVFVLWYPLIFAFLQAGPSLGGGL